MPSSSSKKKTQQTVHGTYAGSGQIIADPLPVAAGTPITAKVTYATKLTQSYGHEELIVFPEIGTCRIPFYGEAAKIYEWLSEVGEITTLKNTPQLGPIQSVKNNYKHSRWDYVCLICHLINTAGKQSREFQLGLNSALTFDTRTPTRFSSAVELLQCWALLANAGHLKDTFAAESVLRQQILRRKVYTDSFLHLFRQPWTGRIARHILHNHSDYRFHLALALLNLEYLPARDRRYRPFAVALASFIGIESMSYLGTIPVSVSYLRRIYRRIRTLAFLALDSHYSGYPVGLSVSRTTQELARYLGDAFSDGHILHSQLVTSLAEHFSSTCYCAPEMVLLNHLNARKLRKHIKRGLKGMRDKAGTLARLKSWRATGFSYKYVTDGWRHIYRFTLDRETPRDLSIQLYPSNRRTPRSDALAMFTYSGFQRQCYLDVYSKANTASDTTALRTVARLGYTQLLKVVFDLKSRYPSSRDDKSDELAFNQRDKLMRHHASSMREYVRAVLQQLADREVRISFKDNHREGINRWYYAQSRHDALIDLAQYCRVFDEALRVRLNQNEYDIRRRELDFMSYVLKRCRPDQRHTLLFTGSVHLYHPRHGEITDVDGLAMVHGRGHLYLLLLQAKDTIRSPVGSAQKWANETLIRTCLPNARGKHTIHRYKSRGVMVSIEL